MHGHPDGTASNSTHAPANADRAALEMEHSASVAAIVASLEQQSNSAKMPETRKHLTANVAISPSTELTKRLLTPPATKKVEQKKETTATAEASSSTTTTTTQTTTQTSTSAARTTTTTAAPTTAAKTTKAAKTTRYYNKHSREQSVNNNQKNNNFSYKNKFKIPTEVDESTKEVGTDRPESERRQYVGTVYTLNTYLTTSPQPPPPSTFYQPNPWQYAPILPSALTTPKPLQTFLAPAIQSGQIYLTPNDLYNLNAINSNSNSNLNLKPAQNLNLSPGPNIFNFDTHLNEFETYQIQRPPASTESIINIPFASEYSTVSPTLLHLSKNITKLYSVVGSSTPDPYNNYQKLPSKPSVTKRKILKLSVTTKSPNRHDRPNPDYHHHYHNENENNYDGHKTNNQNDHHNHFNNENESNFKPTNDHRNPNWNGNKFNVQYNESSQYISSFNSHSNTNQYNGTDFNSNNQKQQKTNTTTTKECIITPNTANLPTGCESNTNDLKITIKFDDATLTNLNQTNNAILKQKQRRKSSTTTTSSPFFYFDASSGTESSATVEESDEDYEFSSYLEPIQNVFGFAPDDRAQRRRPNHGNNMQHGGAKPDVNKFQTIILQSPPPPTTEATKHHSKNSYLHKFLALMPILAILKPLGFGIWTLVLSPILVIAIGGIALGVILYPFLAISREQVAYASLHRSPKIVIHKHPTPRYVRAQKSTPHPAPITYRKPNYSGLSSGSGSDTIAPPFIKRRVFSDMTNRHRRRPLRYSSFSRPKITTLGGSGKRHLPIRMRTFLRRNKRRAQDKNFQQWLLVQNNFNIRVMSYTDE